MNAFTVTPEFKQAIAALNQEKKEIQALIIANNVRLGVMNYTDNLELNLQDLVNEALGDDSITKLFADSLRNPTKKREASDALRTKVKELAEHYALKWVNSL